MKDFGPCFGGHIEWSVRGVLKSCLRDFSHLPWALITTLDSLDDLSGWRVPPILRDRIEPVGTALRLRTAVVVEAIDAGVFSGFDEIWLAQTPPIVAPPEGVFLVSPYDIDVDGMKPTIVEWMKSGTCDVGLGDGIGLNFVSAFESLAQRIEEAHAAASRHE
jgi:hypothetical protein